MFPNTLFPETALVFQELKKQSFIADFYLGGGTALSLQLGHRKSIDLDFFINKLPDHQKILMNFRDRKVTVLLSDETGLNLSLNGTKISFLQYPYPVLDPFKEYEGIKLASILDIACMKINAVLQRGEKKDFYDLFEILKEYSLPDILNAFETKFRKFDYQKLPILKSLVFFDDAEKNPEPVLLTKANWMEVKKKIMAEVKDYTKNEIHL